MEEIQVVLYERLVSTSWSLTPRACSSACCISSQAIRSHSRDELRPQVIFQDGHAIHFSVRVLSFNFTVFFDHHFHHYLNKVISRAMMARKSSHKNYGREEEEPKQEVDLLRAVPPEHERVAQGGRHIWASSMQSSKNKTTKEVGGAGEQLDEILTEKQGHTDAPSSTSTDSPPAVSSSILNEKDHIASTKTRRASNGLGSVSSQRAGAGTATATTSNTEAVGGIRRVRFDFS